VLHLTGEEVFYYREEFDAHGLSGTIRLRHRNVCKDGFGEEPSDIDAGV
jgi:hypothetical protein